MNVLTGRDSVTLVDIADRLLDTGVVLQGEAAISVADVDLIYLSLSVALTSVDRMRRIEAGDSTRAVRPSATRASGGLARYVPSGPGAMNAALHRSSEERLRRDEGVHKQRSVRRGRPRRTATPVDAAKSRLRADLPERVNVDPDEVEQGLAKLVLTIVEFVRQLLERQAVRRMQAGSLTEEEVERVGLAMDRLDRKLTEMAARFGLRREDLALRLGPLGELV